MTPKVLVSPYLWLLARSILVLDLVGPSIALPLERCLQERPLRSILQLKWSVITLALRLGKKKALRDRQKPKRIRRRVGRRDSGLAPVAWRVSSQARSHGSRRASLPDPPVASVVDRRPVTLRSSCLSRAGDCKRKAQSVPLRRMGLQCNSERCPAGRG